MGSKSYDVTSFENGVRTKCDVSNVHDTTPTAAQIAAAMGTPEAGKIITINDAAGGVNFYLCASDGTNYFWLKMTKGL